MVELRTALATAGTALMALGIGLVILANPSNATQNSSLNRAGWGLVIIGAAVVLFVVAWIVRIARRKPGFPDVTIYAGARLFRREQLRTTLRNDLGGKLESFTLPQGSVAVELMNVLIVNREPSRTASLSFQMSARIKPESFGSMEWMPMSMFPPLHDGLPSPLNVAPGTSVGGRLAFLWHGIPELASDDIADEDVTRVDVIDHVSGITVSLGRFGVYPPPPETE